MATMNKTYAQLAREIEALQASANKLLALEVQSAIAGINQSIALYGLTAGDLRFEGARSTSSSVPASGHRQAKGAASSSGSAPKSSDVKFSDGKGQVWSGRGPRPIWLRNALLQGRKLESFAVSGSGASGKAMATMATPANGMAAKPANKLPPLFQDVKTGKTWSGRGPQPAWLKQGLRKRGAVLDDFRVSGPEASFSAPETPAAPVTPPTKAPVAATKKVPAAKKTAAAKKAPAAKKASTTPVAPATPEPGKKAVAKKSAAKRPTAPAGQTAHASLSGRTSPGATPPAKKADAAKKAPASKKVAVKTTPAKKAKAPSANIDSSGSSGSDDVQTPDANAAPSTVPTASPSPV
jgi:DNA-binding protein H-NS